MPHPRSAAPRAHLLAMASAVALVVTSISSAQAGTTSSVAPVADTWVNSQLAGANYGSASVLRVDGSPTWNAFLRFDLSSAAGLITRAQLKLYANSSSTAGISVHRVAKPFGIKKKQK